MTTGESQGPHQGMLGYDASMRPSTMRISTNPATGALVFSGCCHDASKHCQNIKNGPTAVAVTAGEVPSIPFRLVAASFASEFCLIYIRTIFLLFYLFLLLHKVVFEKELGPKDSGHFSAMYLNSAYCVANIHSNCPLLVEN